MKRAPQLIFAALMSTALLLGSAAPVFAAAPQDDDEPGGFDCAYYNQALAWYYFDWYGVVPEDCIKDPEAGADAVNDFEVTAGQKVIAYRGSCTITTESAYSNTTITLGPLANPTGNGAPKLIASGCSVLTNGVLGDTTVLTFAIKNRIFYDKFVNGTVVLWYADGAGNWAPCNTYLYGADLEAEGNPVFGVASCTIVGAVTAFGPGVK